MPRPHKPKATDASLSIGEIINIMAKYSKETGLNFNQMYVDGAVFIRNGKVIKFRVEVLDVVDASQFVIDNAKEKGEDDK